MRRGSFQSRAAWASSKQELEHSFTCGQHRKGEPFTVNASLMQPNHLSQRENSSKRLQSLLLEKCHHSECTQTKAHAQRRAELVRPTESRSTDGEERFGFLRTDPAVFFPRLASETGKPDSPLSSLFPTSTTGRFPLRLAVKALPKNSRLWFRTRNLGVISNLVTIATQLKKIQMLNEKRNLVI